jgi:imidazole glycerol-phosphate synthase subunit HisH
MISVLHYGTGNIGSILNMLKFLEIEAKLITKAEEVIHADKILLPGVGSFDAAMGTIRKRGLDEALNSAVSCGTPLLGICLGMQLLTNKSEEGVLPGFGWIDAEVYGLKGLKGFNDGQIRVPQMGWNIVKLSKESPVLDGFDQSDEVRFYFSHSYYVKCNRERNVIAKTRYGLEFDSIIEEKNVWGVQFHPEKSHTFGMRVFENFAKL